MPLHLHFCAVWFLSPPGGHVMLLCPAVFLMWYSSWALNNCTVALLCSINVLAWLTGVTCDKMCIRMNEILMRWCFVFQLYRVVADQACQERDKAKADLEQADRRNLQLVREVDDRHATMESLNESKIKCGCSPPVI